MNKKTLALCCLLSGLAAPVYGQNGQTLVPATTNPVTAAATTAQVDKIELTLDFNDAPLSTVMDYLSETTGYSVISSSEMSGRITVVSKKPLSLDDALSLINSVMKENGYAVIRTGKILKVVELSEAKKLNIPVRHGNNPDLIPDIDEVVTQVIPVKYTNAVQLQENLMSLLSDYADFSANESSNSLILTDTCSNIKRIVEIVRALDTQMTSVSEVRVFRLAYAEAENVASLVNEIFQSSSTGSSRNSSQGNRGAVTFGGRGGRGGGGGMGGMMGGMMGGGGPGGGGNPLAALFGGGGGQSSSNSARIIAADDEMTNSVVVSGDAETLSIIADMIKELDTNPDEERKLYVYSLQNAEADNIKTLLNSLFSALESINENNTSGMGGRGGGFGGNMGGGGGNAGGGSGSGNDISDETYIEADEDTNSLIIMTSSKNYEKIVAVIKDLDKPVPQVLIKVLIAELTITDETDLGMEFAFARTTSSGSTYTVGSDLIPDVSSTGLNANTVVGDFTGRLHALQQDGKLNVLSRPYILTSNNQTASITVGQEVPFITDSTYSENGQPINTIEYQDIGILLEVTPYINPDGLVIMDVAPEISSISSDTIEITQGVNASIFTKRSSQSKVSVQNGQTVVIGGLMQDDDSEIINKIPILGDIPLIGLLFQQKETKKVKTELLIFLTPQVTDDYLELQKVSDHEQGKSRLLNESPKDSLLNQHIENMKQVAQQDNTAEVPQEEPVATPEEQPAATTED